MRSLLAAVAVVSAGSLSAQVVTATARLGAQGQLAQVLNNVSQTTLGGSPVPPTRLVQSSSNVGGTYSAHSTVSFTAGSHRQLLVLANGARAYKTGLQGGQSFARCHAVVVMQCAQPVHVLIRCDMASLDLSTTFWQLGGTVDVGDDGTTELQWVGWIPAGVLAVTLPAGTTPVAFHAHASAHSHGFYPGGHVDYTLHCSIAPDPNWTTVATPRCDTLSPVLQPQPTYDRQLELQLSTTASPATTIGAFVLGLASANLVLSLPPGCTVGSRPDAVGFVQFDALGQARHTIDLQVLLPGTDVFAQGLSLDASGHVRTSDLVQVTRQ